MKKILGTVIFFVFLLGGCSVPVKWGGEELQRNWRKKMEFDEVQDMLNEMLGEGSFSFSGALKKLVTGEEAFSKEAVQEFLHGLFFSGLNGRRGRFSGFCSLFCSLLEYSQGSARYLMTGRLGKLVFMRYICFFLLCLWSIFLSCVSVFPKIFSGFRSLWRFWPLLIL